MPLRDPVSSASHLLFAIWAAYALLILIRISPRPRRASAVVFGVSMILLYTASGVFHGLYFTKSENPTEFGIFQRIDQSAIFILIAGTNTPIMSTLLNATWRRWCLRGMWLLAFAGVGCLWLLPKPPHEAVVAICLAMGWLGMLPVRQYSQAIGWRGMSWALLACALYTLGASCELAEWPLLSEYPIRVGFHEMFHLLSAAASLAFFLFIARYVLPYVPKPNETSCESCVDKADKHDLNTSQRVVAQSIRSVH